MRSYCVAQVNVINEEIQFNEQILIDKNMRERSFNAIVAANSMLRQCDVVDHIILFHLFRLQSYTF